MPCVLAIGNIERHPPVFVSDGDALVAVWTDPSDCDAFDGLSVTIYDLDR